MRPYLFLFDILAVIFAASGIAMIVVFFRVYERGDTPSLGAWIALIQSWGGAAILKFFPSFFIKRFK